MPPRYVYWTIIVDGQPTAFRSGSLEDIMPTFNRVKEKQPSAELKWFQHGQLWPSRHDAQDFMRARGDRGRERDPRQNAGDGGGDKPPSAGASAGRPERAWNAKPAWKTRTTFSPRGDKPAWVPKGASSPKPQASSRAASEKPAWTPKGEADAKPEWKPKGTFKPKEAGHRSDWSDKPAWVPKGASSSKPQASSRAAGEKPAWRPKGDADVKPAWKPKGTFKPKEPGHASGWGEKPGWKPSPKPQAPDRSFGGKPAWKPKAGGSARDQARSSFRPKSYSPKPDDGMTRSSRVQSRNDKLEWTPKGATPRSGGPNAGFSRGGSSDGPASDALKRKWVPKAEYKKSLGIEAKRDDKWRPGGEHKDPKQKYKDAKKAKWTRVKATIRARSSKPRKPKDE